MKLEVAGLHCRVGATTILSDIDVTVHPGVTCLLGPNGAGKTTLLRSVARTLPPTKGGIYLVDGLNRSRVHRQEIGYVPQGFAFYPHFSCEDLVSYVAAMKRVARAERAMAVRSALSATGLLDYANEKLATLSGGTRQRAAIAQAIVNNPRLLVLDEPTAGLDPSQRRAFTAIIRELGMNRIVMLSTHMMEDVVDVATRVLVMHHGRIVFDGTPYEIAGVKQSDQLSSALITDGYERVVDRYA